MLVVVVPLAVAFTSLLVGTPIVSFFFFFLDEEVYAYNYKPLVCAPPSSPLLFLYWCASRFAVGMERKKLHHCVVPISTWWRYIYIFFLERETAYRVGHSRLNFSISERLKKNTRRLFMTMIFNDLLCLPNGFASFSMECIKFPKKIIRWSFFFFLRCLKILLSQECKCITTSY